MAVINISDLTSKEVDGTGVFDSLMESIQVRLDSEYGKNRIKGPDYAKVYLGAMEGAMSQSIQFILGKQQADKQADLLAAQIIKTEQDTAIGVVEEKKVQQEVSNLTVQGTVLIRQAEKLEQEVLVEQQQVLNMQQQVLKTTAEVSMLGKQEDKIDADIVLAQQQLTSMASEIALTDARKDLVEAQVLSEASQRLKIDAEISLLGSEQTKITQEIALMAQRATNLGAEKLKIDAETALLTARLTSETNQATVLANQANKILAEIDLLVEKRWTERAQYSDTSGAGSTAVTGVIGKQKELYTAQKDGFARDAEQKVLKILADTFNVRKSADPDGTFVNANGFDDASIASVVTKAKQGIGVV